jgi:pimeloyl-[acyl-carrier protein] methyl ester esterase
MKQLLLWHGWGMHPAVWNDLRAELAQLGIDAQAQALPGYDQTAAPSPYTLDALVDQMLEHINSPVTLCGWSLGAMLALHAARRYPQRVARLILISATPCFVQKTDWPHGMPTSALDDFIAALADDSAVTRKRFVALSNQNDVHARTVSRAMTQALSATPLPASDILSAGLALLRDSDLRTTVADITQATLLLHGARDPLMPVAAARWLAHSLPQAQLTILPESAHTPFMSDPGACAAAISGFIHG